MATRQVFCFLSQLVHRIVFRFRNYNLLLFLLFCTIKGGNLQKLMKDNSEDLAVVMGLDSRDMANN